MSTPSVILRVKRRRDNDTQAEEASALPTHISISSTGTSLPLFASLSLANDSNANANAIAGPTAKRIRRFVRVDEKQARAVAGGALRVSVACTAARRTHAGADVRPVAGENACRENSAGNVTVGKGEAAAEEEAEGAEEEEEGVFEYATYIPVDEERSMHERASGVKQRAREGEGEGVGEVRADVEEEEGEVVEEEWNVEDLVGEDGDVDALRRLLCVISREDALDACGLTTDRDDAHAEVDSDDDVYIDYSDEEEEDDEGSFDDGDDYDDDYYD